MPLVPGGTKMGIVYVAAPLGLTPNEPAVAPGTAWAVTAVNKALKPIALKAIRWANGGIVPRRAVYKVDDRKRRNAFREMCDVILSSMAQL